MPLDNKDKWGQLSMKQRADLISIYVNNGFSDIEKIREDYNKNVEHFQSNDANFVQRLRDNDTKYIKNSDGSVSTHKLNYATEDSQAIIYPSVQEHNGTLVDHSEDNMGGLESAIQQKDTVRTSIPFAEWYTQNYKKDYSEFFNRYNKFDGGGDTEERERQLAEAYMRGSNGIDGSVWYLASSINAMLRNKHIIDNIDFSKYNSVKDAIYDNLGNAYSGVSHSSNWSNRNGLTQSRDMINEAFGEDSKDFIDALFYDDAVPYGFIQKPNKDGNNESHIFRSLQDKHREKFGENYRIFQSEKEELDSELVKYLDNLVSKGEVDIKASDNFKIPIGKTTLRDDVGNTTTAYMNYDGQRGSDVIVTGPDGKKYIKKMDVYDFDRDNGGLSYNFLTKKYIDMFIKHAKPYMVISNWKEYNEDKKEYGGKLFANGGPNENEDYIVKFPSESDNYLPTWKRLYNEKLRSTIVPYSLEYVQDVEDRVNKAYSNFEEYKDRNSALKEYEAIYGVPPIIKYDDGEWIEKYERNPARKYIRNRATVEEGKALDLANKYSIPYDKRKEFKLQVGKDKGIKLSTPILDSLAKYGALTNLPIEEVLGLASTETGLGYYEPYTFELPYKLTDGEGYYSANGKISPAGIINYETAFYRNNPFSRAANELDRKGISSEKEWEKEAIRLDKLKYKGPKDENPLKEGFLFYKTGKYNPGEPTHSEKVKKNGEILMTDPNIKKWWEEKGSKYYKNN